MKRFREEGEMESINMANVLMLLSRNVNHHDDHHHHQDSDSGSGSSSGRVFECKTCSRQFSSFQALGGHRASHKRPRIAGEHGHGPQSAGSISKPKVHECSVCGLEFSIGQALGGHMRRHRATATATDGFAQGMIAEKKSDGGERPLWLDLNLPPLDEGKERRRMVFGFELVDKTHMVDCFQ